MPVKIFSARVEAGAKLEANINDWLKTLQPGSVRQISTAACQADTQHLIVTVWYTEASDSN